MYWLLLHYSDHCTPQKQLRVWRTHIGFTMVLVYRGRKGMAWWSVLVPGGERMWQRLFLWRLYFIHIDCTTIEPIDLQHNNYMKNKPSNHEHIKEISGSNLNKDALRIRLCVIHVLMLVCMHVHLYVREDQRFNVSSAVLTATICPPWWTISWNCEPQQTFPSLRSFYHYSM